MKTKHLLFAAALPLAFVACQNEEFDSANSPELSSEQRPLVEVKLDFQKGNADTRMNYDGDKNEYSWENTDEIGALLMDVIKSKNRPFGATAEAWEKETWYQHYELIDHIHTAYPFSWNATEKEWQAPSKLQEGNYFFAAPYSTYEGERQLIHKLDNQKQIGGTEKDMNEAIAANQYFVGYAQIKAGTNNKESLKKVAMTPVLAPVKVTLRNIGTIAKDLEKVVIYGNEVATSLTINPTDAAYGGTKEDDGSILEGKKYNLNSNGSAGAGDSKVFNYANFIGAQDDLYSNAEGQEESFIYNVASGATDYSKWDAVRQIVKEVYSVEEEEKIPTYEKQAVLSFNEPVNVASKGEIKFAVMVNTIPTVTKGQLKMDLIFTQGRITTIDLTTIQKEENNVSGDGLKANTVLTNIEIKSLKPGTKNELIVQFDNNSVVKADEMNVQDATELLAFINWNGENTRKNTVTLLRDVKFTKEMYDAISASAYKGELIVKAAENTEAKLLVDNDVPTNVLNKLEKTTSATIVLDGTRELTKVIADGLKEAKMTIENRGTVTVGEEVVAYTEFVNYGKVEVAEDGEFKGTAGNNITNYGMLENSGDISNVVNAVEENAKGWIKTSAALNNIVSNAKGATIQLTKAAHKISGLAAADQKGTIYLETAEGVTAKVLNDQKVTKLTVTGGTIALVDADNATVEELAINGNVTVKGWNVVAGKDVPAYHELTGVTKAVIGGKVSFDFAGVTGASKTVVNSDAVLTFDDHNSKFNEVTFVKGATLTVNEKASVNVKKVVWNNNDINNYGEFIYGTTDGKVNVKAGKNPKPETAEESDEDKAKAAYETALKAAVKAWASDNRELELTVNNLSYDIINGKKEGTKTAAALFAEYVEANKTKEAIATLVSALDAYKAFNADATLTTGYANAAKVVVEEAEKSEAFKTVAKNLEWSVTEDDADDHIFEATEAEGETPAKTAAQNAIEAFKAAVAGGTVSVTEISHKVVICSSTTNYAPEFSYVCEGDLIYNTFKEIGKVNDWKVAGLTYAYNKNNVWTVRLVNRWIEEVAGKSNANDLTEVAAAFVKDKNLVAIGKTWKYDDTLVAAVAIAVLK